MITKRVPIDTYCEKKITTLQKTYDGLIDYVDISSVDNIEKKITSFQTIEATNAPSRAKQLLKKGDVLVSTVRPNLNAVAVVEEENENILVGSTGYCVLRCKENMNIRYLFNFCQSQYFVDDMSSQATGASYPAVSNGIVRSSLIPCYSIEEQREIAEKIDTVSELLALCKQQLEQLDELVKSRFIELFGDTVLNPYNWNKEPLGKVCDVRDGTHDSPKYYDTGYPLVTSKNLSSGDIDFTDCSLICKNDFDKINERSKVDFGDILMPMIGTVGNPIIVKIKNDFAIKNVALIKFYNDTRVTNVYVQALLKSDYFDSEVLGKVRGGTQKFISLGDIRKLEILVPPIDLQNQFAEFVEQTDKSKLAVQKTLEELEELKKSLMQKYFG